jgi:hypothetical protein
MHGLDVAMRARALQVHGFDEESIFIPPTDTHFLSSLLESNGEHA